MAEAITFLFCQNCTLEREKANLFKRTGSIKLTGDTVFSVANYIYLDISASTRDSDTHRISEHQRACAYTQSSNSYQVRT